MNDVILSFGHNDDDLRVAGTTYRVTIELQGEQAA